jgi:3-dehydroquinate dehydratase-2
MPKPIYVLNGPSLNLLGSREPQIYGTDTLEDVRRRCEAKAATLGYQVVFRQSNREGELVEWLHEAGTDGSAVVLNPAAYGHTSIALLDAIAAIRPPVIECHLSNPAAREDFRRSTYTARVAKGVVCGFGAASYELAIEAAAGLLAKA